MTKQTAHMESPTHEQRKTVTRKHFELLEKEQHLSYVHEVEPICYQPYLITYKCMYVCMYVFVRPSDYSPKACAYR